MFCLSTISGIRQRLWFDAVDFFIDAARLGAGNYRRADYLHKQQK